MDLRSPIRRKVEKRGNANIKKKKKKLPRLNDEEKDGGRGVGRRLEYQRTEKLGQETKHNISRKLVRRYLPDLIESQR